MLRHERSKKLFQAATLPITVFLLYTLYITLCTWCDAVSFLAGFEAPYYILGAIVMAVLCAVMLRTYKFQFRKYKASRLIIVYSGIILVLTFFRSLIPDNAYDTLNYHLYSQASFQHGFEENCAPGSFQLYGFALGDKLFHLPRLFFGYRAGSMFSGVVLCLILYQVSELLHFLCGERLANLRRKYFSGNVTRYFSFLLREETWAFLAVFVHDSVMLLGSYYVELYAIVYLLEALYQLMAPQLESQENAVHFILCAGFLFAIKMTNVVYLLPLVVLYLIKIRKSLTLRLFTLCLVIGFFPCLPYLLVDWVEYGNPVFPYFNTTFKSPYYLQTDFKDGRFGPKTLQETLLWPFYMIFLPGYRQTEIAMRWTGGLAVGMVSTVAVFMISVRRFIQKKDICWEIFSLTIVTIVSFVLWELTTGISRYYVGGYVMINCLLVWFVVQYLLRKNWMKGAVGCLFGALVLTQSISAFDEYLDGWEWSWRKITFPQISKNISCLFRDRVSDAADTENEQVFFALNNLSGITQVIAPNASVYRIDYLYNFLEGAERERLLEETEDLLQTGDVYLLSNSAEFGSEVVEMLNMYGLYADFISVVDNPVYETIWDTLQLHLVPLEVGQSNTLYTTPFVLECDGSGYLTAQCYGGETVAGLYLQLQDDTGNEIVSVPISEDGTVKLSVDLPAAAGDTLIWTLTDSQGEPVPEDGPALLVLNPQFETSNYVGGYTDT